MSGPLSVWHALMRAANNWFAMADFGERQTTDGMTICGLPNDLGFPRELVDHRGPC